MMEVDDQGNYEFTIPACQSVEIFKDPGRLIQAYCQQNYDGANEDRKLAIPAYIRNNQRENFELKDYVDKNGRNLLMLAARDNELETVIVLLKQNFDIDYKDDALKIAIDYAWRNYVNADNEGAKEISDQIIMNLLNANSMYPNDIDLEIASQNVNNFVTTCEEMRTYVDVSKMVDLRVSILSHPKLTYFYNRQNQSLTAFVIDSKIIEVFDLLCQLDLKMGNHESSDDRLRNQNIKFRETIRDRNMQRALTPPAVHLCILNTKSKISSSDDQSRENFERVRKAFEFIDQFSKECSMILQVAATWKPLKIFFDFKHDSTYYFDLTTSRYTFGIIYSTGEIVIGAKNLSDEREKFMVFGTIIHELCHCAALVACMNNFDPYPMGHSDDKTTYADIVNHCNINRALEPIIENVFDCYNSEYWHSELIVRPMQISIEYQGDERAQNAIFATLFKYFRGTFMDALREALPALIKLQNDAHILILEDLTKPMKAKIMHGDILFQGKISSFGALLGNDEGKRKEFLEMLPPKVIHDILTIIPENKIRIGDELEKIPENKYIERKFIKNTTENWCKHQDVLLEVWGSKTMILKETAGTGKTITFKVFAEELKNSYNSIWVSLIKLIDHRKYLQNVYKNSEKVDELEVLRTIIGIKDVIEVFIFDKLYKDGKVILLIDGLDEVHPESRPSVIKLLCKVRRDSTNQLWISTRPHLHDQLNDFPDASVYKFAPCTDDEKSNYLTQPIGNADGCSKPFITTIERCEGKEPRPVNNFLMLSSSTNLCLNNKIHYELNESNIYEMTDKLITEYCEICFKKAYFNHFNVSMKNVHTAYALRAIFAKYHTLNNLAFIKNTEGKNSKKLPPFEEAQYYGLITRESEKEYNFVHNAYAECFVVQFLISFLFDPKSGIKDEEFEKVLNFIKVVANSVDDYEVMHKFMFSYFQNEQIEPLSEDICKIVSRAISDIREDIFKKVDAKSEHLIDLLKFWTFLFSKNHDLLNELWEMDKEKMMIVKIYDKNRGNVCGDILNLLKKISECFEPQSCKKDTNANFCNRFANLNLNRNDVKMICAFCAIDNLHDKFVELVAKKSISVN